MNEASRVLIEQHVASCTACRDRVNEITENLRLVEPLKGSVRQDAEMTQAAPAVPDWIGPYRVLRRVGRGGMGVVYEAEQQNPRRTVALKVLHSTAHLDDHYERLFRREVQVLAHLRHPSIAAIHEAGRAPDGRSYFAMELVQGVSLLQYASQASLSHEARLRLFKDVCDAIAYAHQRGVIHRDLKPSNILVDAAGRPKVLDFGLAKVLEVDPEAPAMTAVTEVGRIQGTLPYMSPEQVRGEPLGIDIRSDVYSLGVVLYELLVGRLPYVIDSNNLLAAAKAISEQQPVPPSSIDRTLRGDLETILKKALEKDKEHRYQSAAEFAEDIRRYLHDETVIARPPSRSYQLRKFAKRNRPFVAAAAAVFLVLVAGIVGVTVALQRAQSERDRAIRAEQAAETRRSEAQAVIGFLTDMLRAADPAAGGRDLTVRDALDRAAQKIDTAFQEQPVINAGVRSAIGEVYFSLGVYDQAEANLKPAMDVLRREYGDHLDVAGSIQNVAVLLTYRGDLVGAEPLFREAIAMRKRLGDEGSSEMGAAWNQLAALLQKKGDFPGSEDAFQEALVVQRRVQDGPHRGVVMVLNNLGSLWIERGKNQEAEVVLREATDIYGQIGEENTSEAATTMGNLAAVLRNQGRYDEAEPLQRKVLTIQRKLLGNDHPSVGLALHNLGTVLSKKGQHEESESLLRESLRVFKTVLGPEHTNVGIVSRGLGEALLAKGDASAAEELLRQAVEIHRKTLPSGHWQIAVSESSLGECYLILRRYDEAEPLLVEGYRKLKAAQGDKHRLTQEALERVVHLFEASGEQAQAEEYRSLRSERE
jgi:serine/threonine protein kinase/Tfp pilus assembly protein PilF